MSLSDGPPAAARRTPSNLQLRIVSGVVLAAAALGVTWLGGTPFRLFSALVASAMFFEWCAMARAKSNAIHQTLSGLLLVLALVLAFGGLSEPLPAIASAFGLSLLLGLMFGSWRWTVAGLIYAGLSGIALAGLRDDTHEGFRAILLLFSVVWTTDIMAYFIGRAVGGPKLAPAISPGKTWSGAVGGAVSAVIAGVAAAASAGVANLAAFAFVALLLSVASQAGDLLESWVKRRHGAKDSGWLIPGHGGVMDRVDGLVAAAAAFYLVGLGLGSGADPVGWLFRP